ncbi:hypothetical protein AUEXF2481DRAFT_189676 [Aureobasidium subglaciale EXF-2481]|uniref:Uncharacterized protein n=1 Tax=Aureobasidium subglaciale (strain EXF-2481) TaxID=1043005 RepID=A0A074YU34_AURSE|nr:uncharacterized protein AUEXF2481DRAFT_189676 [Aureobasidium subglaciale EXF-2481]KEQ99664.1 hypothetical protein AUEXF2481DRAFT_189676 [Aureobasidium subglaciale EXF-2481]
MMPPDFPHKKRLPLPISRAKRLGISPLPQSLHFLRLQLSSWLQFIICLMHPHHAPDASPIPTIAVGVLAHTIADFLTLEHDILTLMSSKVQVTFHPIRLLGNHAHDLHLHKRVQASFDSALDDNRQKPRQNFADYLSTLFYYPGFDSRSVGEQISHVLKRLNVRYKTHIAKSTRIPEQFLTMGEIVRFGAQLDAEDKHFGGRESLSYLNTLAETETQLLQMIERSNASRIMYPKRVEKPVDLGLEFNDIPTCLDYYTRFKTPTFEIRHLRQARLLESTISLQDSTVLEEPYIPDFGLRAFFPSLEKRQWAIPHHCEVLGTVEEAHNVDLQQVFEQEEEDQWYAVSIVDEDTPQQTTGDGVREWSRGGVEWVWRWPARVAFGKEAAQALRRGEW